jgi:DNA ligase-1
MDKFEQPIYGQDKNGKTKIWKASIRVDPDGKAVATIEHGYVDGKLQTTVREYTEGKNIGRKNETTPLQQCVQETARKRQDKIEKEGYAENLTATPSTHTIFPMLAHKYDPNTNSQKKNGIVFPCFTQPKLDGLRCVVYLGGPDGPIQFQSRTGSQFVGLEHLARSLTPIFRQHPTLILDGELYTDQMPFEQLAGLIKKKKFAESDRARVDKIEYHVYDHVIKDTPFVERLRYLHDTVLGAQVHPSIFLVETLPAKTVDEVKHQFARYVERGYEGIMLRNINGVYQVGHRSHDLQKYKEFFEDEYEIRGFKEGDGRDKGTVIWICACPDGREFSVRPRGSTELRRELYESARAKPDAYIGRHLTVIYQELSEQGVPRFPVGKDVRVAY